MYQVIISLSEETVTALNLAPEQLGDEIRLVAAVKFYELERFSSEMAAKFVGVPKPVFLSKLAEYGVDTFRLTEAELLRDLANA